VVEIDPWRVFGRDDAAARIHKNIKRIDANLVKHCRQKSGLVFTVSVTVAEDARGGMRLVPADADFDGLALLASQFRAAERPNRGIRAAREQADAVRLDLKREGGASLRQRHRRQHRSEGGGPETGHQLASIERKFGACHPRDPDHF